MTSYAKPDERGQRVSAADLRLLERLSQGYSRYDAFDLQRATRTAVAAIASLRAALVFLKSERDNVERNAAREIDAIHRAHETALATVKRDGWIAGRGAAVSELEAEGHFIAAEQVSALVPPDVVEPTGVERR